jgi:hypothetical protein
MGRVRITGTLIDFFKTTATGIISAIFPDAGAPPTEAGELLRHGADIKWHDGTAARTVVSTDAAQTLSNKTLSATARVAFADQGADPTSAGTLQRNAGFLRYHTGTAVRTLNPPEAITLRRDGKNQWRLYDEMGAEVNISGSTTSGLQEAIDLAWTRGRDLKVLGGGGLRLGGGTLPANPFSTVTGSTTVTVNHPSHGFTDNDITVHFLGSTAVNGIPASEINSGPGTAHPITIIDANTYTFTVTTPATATGSGGGTSVTWTASRDVSVLHCTSTVTFPPMHTKSVFIDSLTIDFPSSLGGNDGIVVDSCMSVDMDLRCQIAYAGTGAAVRFKPTNPEPVDNQITIVDSRFYLRTVAGRVVFDASTGAITNNHILIVECNSTDGVRLIGSQSIAFNTFLLLHVHAPTGIGVAVGNSATSLVHNNFIRAFISPGTGPGPALWVWGQENLIEVLIHDGEGLVDEGIKLESSAARNLFRVYKNAASTPVNDQSTSKDNEGLFGWVKPRCFVHRNGVNQSGVPSGSAQQVMFTTRLYDDGNTFDTTTSRWVPGRRGRVHVTAAVRWLNVADATTLEIQLRKNGAIVASVMSGASGTAGQGPSLAVDATVDAPTDYFEIFVQQNSGTARDINGASSVTFFSGHML